MRAPTCARRAAAVFLLALPTLVAAQAPHTELADPVRQRDVTRRWIEWIDRHFAAGRSPAATQ